VCLPPAGLFARSAEDLRWSIVDGRFPTPPTSLVAGAAAPGRGVVTGDARRPADSDGE